ncbi:hypothetical protein Tco_1031761 [Tanacetum coccineum]|uniref:Uncharacterized protein n=1 Tax=Tanacetum coccineum TaxID=301880 RepID=A0ABQ5GAF6_9ASTR
MGMFYKSLIKCSSNIPLVKFLLRKSKAKVHRRVVKKKVTITTDDNIVPEPDAALELVKSISLTEAAVEEAARQIYTTHARIVTELVPEPTRRRSSEDQQETASTRSSSERTRVSPGVLDKSTIVPATSSEGTGTKLGVLDEEKVNFEANVILKWVPEQESEYSGEEDDDDEMIE